MEYTLDDGVAVLDFDDGKANAVSHDLIDGLLEGLDRAEGEASAVVLAGRPGMFSGGFDLKEIQKGPDAATALVGKGAHLMFRLFTYPGPVVAACTGHAIAAGAFILLACDTRIGTEGDFKIGLNETAIGMTLPVFGVELSKARLSKRHLTDGFIQSYLYGPDEAVDAGFLDRVVAADAARGAAIDAARALGELPKGAYAGNKMLIRAPHIDAIRASLT